MTRILRRTSLVLLIAAVLPAAAQQHEAANGVFLVAKPGLTDPNFSESVVLVTQTEDGHTVGVIVNRPAAVTLSEALPDLAWQGEDGGKPIFFGGPVMQQAVAALFRSAAPPQAPAYHVLRDVYLTMHPDTIRELLAARERPYRLYAGHAGWAPGQLESELERDGWYIVPAQADTALRDDVQGLWRELVRFAETRPIRDDRSGK